MIKLKDTVSKNGFVYKCVQRAKKKALYAQYHKNTLIGLEVFKIRIRGTQFSHILNKSLLPAERFPSNEDFGKSAWTFRNFQDAINKYEEL